jgi:protein SCO1/2
MCPLIIDTARMTERKLDAEQLAGLSVLLVSMDAKRDDPAALTALAGQRKIDTQKWTLARTDASNVRKLAAVLGIQYRELDDGEFSHTSVLILLDAEGRIVARTETMGKTDPEFVDAVRRVLEDTGA